MEVIKMYVEINVLRHINMKERKIHFVTYL